MPDEPQDQKRKADVKRQGGFMALGIALGAALGAAFDNVAMGVAFGVVAGAVLSAAAYRKTIRA